MERSTDPSQNDSCQTPRLERRPRLGACFAAITRPELYRNFAIHIFVMLPAAMIMCAIGKRIDSVLGFGELLPASLAWSSGLSLILIGGVWVWYVYGYLYLSGGGSPGTHVDGGPHTLVDTGPYTVIRHPSVLGKLGAVIGLGLIWSSPSFVIFFVPLLLIYSLITNRLLQERYCYLRFGATYQRYRERVPMLMPRPSGLRRWLHDQAAVDETGPRATGEVPPGMWKELRWYLVGLLGLLSLFSAIYLALGYLKV